MDPFIYITFLLHSFQKCLHAPKIQSAVFYPLMADVHRDFQGLTALNLEIPKLCCLSTSKVLGICAHKMIFKAQIMFNV